MRDAEGVGVGVYVPVRQPDLRVQAPRVRRPRPEAQWQKKEKKLIGRNAGR